MEEKYFLTQIKHTSGNWEKGTAIKNTLDEVRQSYHAYLGAYGYGHDPNTDYVACYTFGLNGQFYDETIDDRRQPVEEPEEQ